MAEPQSLVSRCVYPLYSCTSYIETNIFCRQTRHKTERHPVVCLHAAKKLSIIVYWLAGWILRVHCAYSIPIPISTHAPKASISTQHTWTVDTLVMMLQIIISGSHFVTHFHFLSQVSPELQQLIVIVKLSINLLSTSYSPRFSFRIVMGSKFPSWEMAAVGL